MAQRTQPSSPARRETAPAEVVDDPDPTYSHFGHRDEFLGLLKQFLATDVQATPSPEESEAEDELVKKMGAIVGFVRAPITNLSSTTTFPCLVC